MTVVDVPPVVYLCGCEGAEVGMAFETGLLVCPRHREPVGPWDRPPATVVRRCTFSFEVEAGMVEQTQVVIDLFERIIFESSFVRSLETVVDQ